MPEDTADEVFVIKRTFAAPIEKLWATLTSADQISAWMGPPGITTTNLKFELRPGGVNHTRFQPAEGPPYWGKFVYREIVEPTRLVWVHAVADADENVVRAPWHANWPLELLTTVVLEAVNDGAGLTLTWAPLNPTPLEQDAFAQARPSMEWGWGGSLDRLGDHLAATGGVH